MNAFRPSPIAISACLLLLIAVCWVTAQSSTPPANPRLLPRPEPIAETRLLMEGLNQSNFEGLDRLLAQKPTSAESWGFARGQALLIAETANLLMLRPPRREGQSAWLDRALDLRTSAVRLARSAGSQNYDQCR